MAAFLLRRLAFSVVVLLGALVLVFTVLHLSGDPVSMMLPMGTTPAEIAEFRHRMGLDRPLLSQFVQFLGKAVAGDFGMSLQHRRPALDLVFEHLPPTLLLSGAAMVVAVVVAMPLGIFAAVHRRSLWDTVASTIALVGQSLPTFYIGIVAILFFAIRWRLLPTSGYGSWRHLILPALTLSTFTVATIMRVVRNAMAEALAQDHIRTARAKGVPEQRIVLRAALRNAAIPIVTILGLQFGILLTGAFVTETVFSWPGVGRLAVNAIHQRDVYLVQATVVVTLTLFIVVNLLVDLAYALLDPRVRLR